MGCMEPVPINCEVEKALGITIEEIDAVGNPQYIKDYPLKATPTIILLQDGTVRGRFEGCPPRTVAGNIGGNTYSRTP
jgi:thioredoxin 1